MINGPSKKQQVRESSENTFLNILFKVLLLCINFFISIGEGTRVLFSLPLLTVRAISTWFSEAKMKLTRRQTAMVESPVAARISEKRKKQIKKHKKLIRFPHLQFPQLNLPKIRIPRVKLSLKLPSFSFPKLSFTLPTLSKRKAGKKTTVKKETKAKRLASKSGKSFGIYVIFIFKIIIRYVLIFFKVTWGAVFFILLRLYKGLRNTLSFLVFLIRKPFEFLNTLFTAQLRFFLLGILICGVFFVTKELHEFVESLPSPKEIGKVNYSLATHLNDRNGRLLYEIYRDEKRTPIKIADLPRYVTQSSIAIEDKDFYNHKGVSLISGILRAGKETLFKGSLQGGSTITQQLVKSALLSPERTLTRKTKEIILALWAEQMYTKEEILQMYMNQVPYGGAAYGIQEAAKTYFGKDAKDLTIAESSLLAGLPQAPSTYSPFVNPNLAVERRNDVLLKMKEQKYITDSQYKAALSTPLEIIRPEIAIKAPHFVFYIKSELEKEYGTRMVEQGGLRVTTTLDLEVQQEVEKILQDELEKQKYLNVSNGAVLVTKPATGEIIAMVGSVDYFQEPYGAFNVTNAERQPGSSLKPLLYSLALQKGATAATTYNDAARTFVIPGAEPYKPINYDGKFHGRVSLRNALANSYNLPAVEALYNVGIQSFVDYMKSLGITTWNDPGRYVLPMALGGVEVKMVDEATAYGALANYGKKTDLTGVLKLHDSKEEELAHLEPESTQVMPEGAAYIISDILADNQARATAFGPGSQLEIPGYKVAIKTGTTDSKRDNWSFGYTPEYLVSVWIGNNDNSPMNPAIESGATGASSLWHRVMEYMLKNHAEQPTTWYSKPEGIVERSCGGKPEYFLAGTDSNYSCAPSPTRPQRTTTPTPQAPRAEATISPKEESPKQAFGNYNAEQNRYVNR